MPEPRWLDQDEDRAWRGYRRLRALLDLQINRDLARDSGLSEPDYDVLSNLSETAGHRQRLSDLVALTRQGLHAIETAAPGHVASVRRHFIDLLSTEQIAALGDITQTVLTHLATVERATPA